MQATMEASDKVNSYLRSRMTVEDYAIASVALMKHQGSTYPIAIGAFGKVNILVGVDQVRQLFLKGWSSSGKYEEMLKKSEKQKQKYESILAEQKKAFASLQDRLDKLENPDKYKEKFRENFQTDDEYIDYIVQQRMNKILDEQRLYAGTRQRLQSHC